MYEWAERRRAENAAKHGIDFAKAGDFEWDSALTFDDVRRGYGELRHVSFGFIGTRLHVLVWTPRGEQIRVISLRRANSKEIKRYVEHD